MVRMTREEKARLRALADKWGVSAPEVIRQLIRHEVGMPSIIKGST
jgi:hypothetical protein